MSDTACRPCFINSFVRNELDFSLIYNNVLFKLYTWWKFYPRFSAIEISLICKLNTLSLKCAIVRQCLLPCTGSIRSPWSLTVIIVHPDGRWYHGLSELFPRDPGDTTHGRHLHGVNGNSQNWCSLKVLNNTKDSGTAKEKMFLTSLSFTLINNKCLTYCTDCILHGIYMYIACMYMYFLQCFCREYSRLCLIVIIWIAIKIIVLKTVICFSSTAVHCIHSQWCIAYVLSRYC